MAATAKKVNGPRPLGNSPGRLLVAEEHTMGGSGFLTGSIDASSFPSVFVRVRMSILAASWADRWKVEMGCFVVLQNGKTKETQRTLGFGLDLPDRLPHNNISKPDGHRHSSRFFSTHPSNAMTPPHLFTETRRTCWSHPSQICG